MDTKGIYTVILEANLNASFIVGRIAFDPEFRGQDENVLSLKLVTEEKVETEDGGEWTAKLWHDVTVYDPRVIAAAKQFSRFKQNATIAVLGENVSRSWEKKDDKGQPILNKKTKKPEREYRYDVRAVDLLMAHREQDPNGQPGDTVLVWESFADDLYKAPESPLDQYDTASSAGEAGVDTKTQAAAKASS